MGRQFCYKDKSICLHNSFLHKLNIKLLRKYSKLYHHINMVKDPLSLDLYYEKSKTKQKLALIRKG